MTQYNPRYDTKVQPFNISFIKYWINEKDIKELKQWLDEGEPHKRLMKEAIAISTTNEWFEGLKILFEKDWISLSSKLNEVIGRIRFCKKDDVWIFVRDLVFSDKKLIKKFSFKLFWEARENKKELLFDENKVDFSDDEASSLLMYSYMFPDKNYSEERKIEYQTQRDYLLSKPVYLIPYQLISLMDFQNASYVVEMLKKHKEHPILKTKEDLFVFACVSGVYYQAALNRIKKFSKHEHEKAVIEEKRIKEEQSFMLDFLKKQGVVIELDLTPKFLEKNNWINYNLENNYGNFCASDRYGFVYGSLDLKYYRTNESKDKQKLPEKQKVKLAWYWIGGEYDEKRSHYNEKYVMTNKDKVYAEKEFAKL